jgi:hypothetical protein
MISDIVVVDNFFENPDGVVVLAKQQNFLSDEHHPQRSFWVGHRTLSLHEIDPKFFQVFMNLVFNKSLNNLTGTRDVFIKFDYNALMYFHYLTKDYSYTKDWKHSDRCLMAGVVYLTKNPPIKSGTMVWKNGIKNKKIRR